VRSAPHRHQIRPPTSDEKLASVLLALWDKAGEGIPFEVATQMSAEQIVSLIEFPHDGCSLGFLDCLELAHVLLKRSNVLLQLQCPGAHRLFMELEGVAQRDQPELSLLIASVETRGDDPYSLGHALQVRVELAGRWPPSQFHE
jgi:hypothetical protein